MKNLEEKINFIKSKRRLHEKFRDLVIEVASEYIKNFNITKDVSESYIDTYLFCVKNDIDMIPECENPKCKNLVIKDPKKTKLQKYCSLECRNDDCSRSIVENNMRKHGVRCTLELEDVKNKAKETILKRYGVDNVMKSKEFQNKAKETMMRKYGRYDNRIYLKEYADKKGVNCPMALDEIKNKMRSTVMERYGVDNVMKSLDIRNKNLHNARKKVYEKIKDNNYAEPLFEFSDFEGYFKPYSTVINKYPFKCKSCGKEFEDYMFAFESNTSISIHNFPRCPKCFPRKTSVIEKELYNDIRKILGDEIKIEDSYRIPGSMKEIDIYIPDLKIGIEMNGLYFHSEKGGKDSRYHLDKTLKAHEAGIRIIRVYSDEYINKKEIVIEKLKHILRKNDNPKVYARKCEIRVVSEKDAKEFYDRNHIQGHVIGCMIHYGLYHNSKLVSMMSFSKVRKSLGSVSSDSEFELTRFANDIHTRVLGSFGKLLKEFKKEYSFDRIVSYADIRWSSLDHNIYVKNGLTFKNQSKPSYYYIKSSGGNDSKRYNRFTFRKNVLKDKFPDIYSDNLTEKEIMEKAGFSRIWNCGNIVYEIIGQSAAKLCENI